MKKKYDIKTTDVETLKKWYHLMTLGRALDEKAPSYQLQSLGWSYHAPYAGHDGIQLAVCSDLGTEMPYPLSCITKITGRRSRLAPLIAS